MLLISVPYDIVQHVPMCGMSQLPLRDPYADTLFGSSAVMHAMLGPHKSSQRTRRDWRGLIMSWGCRLCSEHGHRGTICWCIARLGSPGATM